MFKKMHPAFWWGIAIIYGYALVFWIIEMSVPGFIYNTQIGGIPAPYIYGLTVCMLGVNLVVSYLWYVIPKRDAERKQAAQEAGKGADQ